MSDSCSHSSLAGKGKGRAARQKNKKRRKQTAGVKKPRQTETAPHILAALEAQRRRASLEHKSSPPQPVADHGNATPPCLQPRVRQRSQRIPGFVFDNERNRFFRVVKNSSGIPGGKLIGSKMKTAFFTGNLFQGHEAIGRGSAPGGSQTSGRMRVPGPNNAAVRGFAMATSGDGDAQDGSDAVGSDTAAGTSNSRTSRAHLRGLHSYVMNRSRGLFNQWASSPGWSDEKCWRGFTGGPPAGPEQVRRAAFEAITSSSRFRVQKRFVPESLTWYGSFTAVDWDPDVQLVTVGMNTGELGFLRVLGSGAEHEVEWEHGLRRGHGAGMMEHGVSWGGKIHAATGQVSDIKFHAFGQERAYAFASLGCEGQAGGVSARRCMPAEGAVRQVRNTMALRRQRTDVQLKSGSAWCIEWDPSNPKRLGVGPSSRYPISFFDVERQRLTSVAKLTSDVFSLSFLPPAAPGAGHTMICGLRDGSVVLLDSRQPQRHNSAAVSASARSNDGIGNEVINGIPGGKQVMLRRANSVDQTHVLGDGTRCLVKDRSGGLCTVDMRFFFPGKPPLSVLVPPLPDAFRTRAPVPGRFALDPAETIVAIPVAAAADYSGHQRKSGGNIAMGGGERFLSSPRAWDAFAGVGSIGRSHYMSRIDERDAESAGSTGSAIDHPSVPLSQTPAKALAGAGDSLRILSLTTGHVLKDIVTPWTGMSLARGAVRPEGGSAKHGCYGDVRFWGIASEPGERGKPLVFDAGLQPLDDERE